MEIIQNNKQHIQSFEFQMTEYAAYYRLDDMLEDILDGKDVSRSEMEYCPQLPMLSATLSSVLKNRETEHFHKAVDILWELDEVFPNIIPFESFGNLIIDILICKILMDLTNLDTVEYAQLVNDILGSFRIPEDIKLSGENRKWLCKKYEAISKKLIVLVHNEDRDLTLSYLNLRNCDCFWDNINSRVDMYLDKVNEKFGLPILEALLRHGKQHGKEKSQRVETSSTETNVNASEIHAETISSDCREGISVLPTDDVNTNDGETVSAVERFDQPEIDEEHQLEITSQTNCQSKEDLLNSSIEDVCVNSDTEESNSTFQDVLETVNDRGGKEINNLSDDKVSMENCDEESDRSMLSEGDEVCLRTQTDAGKEVTNFSDDDNGSVSGVEETDCSMLNEGDESNQEDRPKFPVITDLLSTIDQANITSKSCDSVILFDSDNTVDETIDKEELETDTCTINEQNDSTKSISKPLSVHSKARGNNHGHTMNKEAVRKDISPYTESSEGPASIDTNSSNDVNGAHINETATKDIISIDRQTISPFTTSSEDSDTDNEGNEAISKKEVIEYLVSIINRISDESESTEDPVSLETINNDVTAPITEEKVTNSRSTSHKPDGLQTETIENIKSLDTTNNNNEMGGLISKEADEEDRMLANDHTSETNIISLDIIDNNNEMGRLISKEAGEEDRMLANDHTSETEGTNSFGNCHNITHGHCYSVNDTNNSLDIIDNNNEMGRLISKEAGEEDRMLANDHTSETEGTNSFGNCHNITHGHCYSVNDTNNSLDIIDNNNEMGRLISKEAGEEDRMLANDHTSETNIISLDIIDNNNEMGRLISKEAGEEDRMLANDHTSETECVEEVRVRIDPPTGIAHTDSSVHTTNPLPTVKNVSDSNIDGILSLERVPKLITNNQSCQTESTQVHAGVNTSLSHNKVDDTSFIGKDAINEGLITGQPNCPSIEIGENRLNIDMNIICKNSDITDEIGNKKDRLGSDISLGMQTQSNKGNLMGKNITYNTATTASQTHKPPPVSGVCTMHIDKAQSKVVGIVNALQKVCNIDTPVSQRSTSDLVNSGDNVNNQNDTSILSTGATTPLQKVSDLPNPANQSSGNDLVNPGKNNQAHQNNVPSSKNINYPRRIDNTQNKIVATISPLAKISDTRSLADNPISKDPLNDAKTYHTNQKEPVTKDTNTTISQETDSPSTELPSTNEQAPSIEKSSHPLSINNIVSAIGSIVRKFGNLRSVVVYPDCENDGKNSEQNTSRRSGALPLGNIHSSSTTLHTSGTANSSQEPNIFELNEQYIEVDNMKYLLLVRPLAKPNSQASICDQNETNNQSRTDVCVSQTNLSQKIVSLATKNAYSSGRGCSNRLDSRINKCTVETRDDQRDNIKYLPLVRPLAKPKSQASICDQNETNSVIQTNLSQKIVSLAAKNAYSSGRGCCNRPDTVETRNDQRNGEHSIIIRDQEHFKTLPTSSKKGIKKESTVSKASCNHLENKNQLGCVSNRCLHSIINNQETEGTNSFGNCHLNNPPSAPKEELESSLLNIITHDHCYSVNDANNSTPSRKRSSTFTLSPQVSKKRKTSLPKQSISAQLNTKEQIGVLQNYSNRINDQLTTAMQNRPSDKGVFSENIGSNQANRNTHQPIPARLETDEQQNLGLQQNSCNRVNERLVSSKEGFSNSTSNVNILSENKGLNQGLNRSTEGESASCNCTIYEKNTACMNVSLTAQRNRNKETQKNITPLNNIVGVWKTSDKKEDNATPHSETSFPQILTLKSSFLSQASSCQSGESLTIPGSPNSTSEDDRSFVRSPTIFDFFRPNSQSLTQDGDTCSKLEKNRWSSTDESSEESRKCFSAVDATKASNSIQDSRGFTEKKDVRLDLDHSVRIIDESSWCKDSSQTKRTDLTGNSKALTKTKNTEFGLNSSVQVIEKSTGYKDVFETACNRQTKCADPLENSKQLTKSEVLDGTREHLSKSSDLIRKVSYKRKRTGLLVSCVPSGSLKLSNSAGGIHSYKRSRAEHNMQSSPIRSQGTDPSEESNSEVQTSEVQDAEVQIPKVQSAEVQIPEVQSAEVQTTMAHNSEVQSRKVQNSEVQNSELQKSKIQTLKVLNDEIQTCVIQSSDEQSSVELPNPGEESEETMQSSEESSCWEPSSGLQSSEESNSEIQSSEVQNSEGLSNPGEESEETSFEQTLEESSSWEPSSGLLSQEVLSSEEQSSWVQSAEVSNFEDQTSEASNVKGQTSEYDKIGKGKVLRSQGRVSFMLSNTKFLNSKRRNYEYSSSEDFESQKLTVRKIKNKYTKILRPSIYTQGVKRCRLIPAGQTREAREKSLKESSLLEDEMPLSQWKFLRNLSKKSSSSKRRRLLEGTIASTSARFLGNERSQVSRKVGKRKCTLDAVVKLVKLKAELLL